MNAPAPLRISVVGLGKLGASMAAVFASRGMHVLGHDLDPRPVEALRAGRAPVQEPGLADMIAAHSPRIDATTDPARAVHETDITFIVVPTPSEESGRFSLVHATSALETLGAALRSKSSYHFFVLTSTVLPGACRESLIPTLERASGRVCGRDFGFCYHPEFVALGTVLRDFLRPALHLAGQFDVRSGDVLEPVLRAVAGPDVPLRRMRLEEAELAKVALNSFVTLKISFANLLGEFCQRIPGTDVDAVSAAIGLDPRVGTRFLSAGASFGGPCFPRDNVALAELGRSLGVDCGIFVANTDYNRALTARQAAWALECIPSGARIAVLGLAYKPLSNLVEEAPGIHLCHEFLRAGHAVLGHDPIASADARRVLPPGVQVCEHLDDALAQADALVVATPDPAFRALTPERLAALRSNQAGPLSIVDLWRVLDPAVSDVPGVAYAAFGRNPA